MNFSYFKNSKNLLTNEQMKNVMGGGTGSCGYRIVYNDGQADDIQCGISKSSALGMATVFAPDSDVAHTYWCCDSCATSSYCG